jgi:hypothetical protein
MNVLPSRPVRFIEDTKRYYTCSNCGFICDSQTIKSASINENVGDVVTIIDSDGDHNVGQGCPFCGSLLSKM